MNNYFTELSPFGLIKISGPDALKFLQGQLTCDVQEVTQQQSRLGAHCDNKGRVQATFRLFNHQTDYYLQLPVYLISHLLNLLKKYAVFSKVTLTDVSTDWRQLGVSGQESVAILSKIISEPLPTAINAVTQHNDIFIIRIPGIIPRFCVLGSIIAINSLMPSLATQLKQADYSAWLLQDIAAGIPTLFPETIGLFTPHQINYPAINGVSFNKGCYIGQEIIARMQYLGKLKQRMYRISFTTDLAPPPGTKLISGQSTAPQECGTLVEATLESARRWQGLAVIYDSATSQTIHLANPDGPILNVLELPYTV